MDLVIKALAQAPLVAVFVWMWWTSRKDMMAELDRLRRRVEDKDMQLGEFARVFEKLSVTLELVKDRLR